MKYLNLIFVLVGILAAATFTGCGGSQTTGTEELLEQLEEEKVEEIFDSQVGTSDAAEEDESDEGTDVEGGSDEATSAAELDENGPDESDDGSDGSDEATDENSEAGESDEGESDEADSDVVSPPVFQPTVTSYNCINNWYNGGRIQVGENSDILVHEFPGAFSRRSKLHIISNDTGEVRHNVNNDLPLGGAGFVRTTDGKYFVHGGSFNTTQIFEIESVSGQTISVLLDGEPSGYTNLLGVDRQDNIYLKKSNQIFMVDPYGASEQIFTTVPFVPDMLVFSFDKSTIYLANHGTFGAFDEEGGYRQVESLDDGFFTNLIADDSGNIFASIVEGDDYVNCLMGMRNCTHKIVVYQNAGGSPVLVSQIPGRILSTAYDFSTKELVVAASVDRNSDLYNCDAGKNTVILRIGGIGGVHSAEEDATGGDVAEDEESDRGGGRQDVVCGRGTMLVGNVCVSTVPEGYTCGAGTQVSGSSCVPSTQVDCSAMLTYCMDWCGSNGHGGWTPCVQACYGSADYCEDHFRW